MLKNKTIIVGVTGGIAAYKTCEVVSRLKKLGAEVWVVMTAEATRLVSPLTFRTLSGNPVITDLFSPELSNTLVPHITLTQQADLLLIAPCTANIIGKIAGGIADDPLTTMVLAATCKKMLAPAMNAAMWKNPLVAKNVKTLTATGYSFIGPEEGELACGTWDVGRMSEPKEIVEKVVGLLGVAQDLKGKHILVTAGGTREAIDPVRYISNRSSGKMGYALARGARGRGATVTLISSANGAQPPVDVKPIKVESAQEMLQAVLDNYGKADAIVMAAAVADFRPKLKTQKSKLKNKEIDNLLLEPTQDILKTIAKQKGRKGKVVVGFALETDHQIENAKKKLKDKDMDLIAANDESTFDSDSIKMSLIDRKGKVENFPVQSKEQAAQVILDQIVCLLK